MDRDGLERLAAALRNAGGSAVALTGAGVSVPSGIPDFRGGGAGAGDALWQRYDPAVYATAGALERHPQRVWAFLWELDAVLAAAEPNAAHRALADLEAAGWLRAVITQNPDGLHQRAGSRTVREIHGTAATLSCAACGRQVARAELLAQPPAPPRCHACDGMLRPDVTLFGEALPARAMAAAQADCAACDVLLVVGTSAEVEPAASLPRIARDGGATVWELNPEPARSLPARQRLRGRAEQALPALVARLGAV